jgi:hypothetical protein
MSAPYTGSSGAAAKATRNLVSATPADTPTSSTTTKPSDHYERAAAEAAKAGTMPSTTATSAAAVGVQKQQSWKMSDLRAQKQGDHVDEKAGGMGYSSTTACCWK